MMPFAFLNPWVLTGLLLLPGLYYLLRVTPPPPRRIVFPAARFLAGLTAETRTALRTPWWILLLRMATCGLVIIALAHPVLHPAQALSGNGPVRIVVDNGWASARNWPAMSDAANDIAARAARAQRPVYILPTAPDAGTDRPSERGPLAAGEAQAVLRGLKPLPWPSDYAAAAKAMATPAKGATSVFLSTGAEDASGAKALLDRLAAQGDVMVMAPGANRAPLLLRRATRNTGTGIAVDAPAGARVDTPVAVTALGVNGAVLDIAQGRMDADSLPANLTFTAPGIAGKVARYVLPGAGAGGVLLNDDPGERRSVGIVSAKAAAQATPLIDPAFYITRALSPYDDLRAGSVEDLLKARPAVIVMPDTGAIPAAELNALQAWIENGGLLLRFAGPEMSQSPAVLTPVPLRGGGRALSGAMTWEKPLHLAPFPKTGPLYGLDAPADVTVRQQVLAEPSDGLDKKTWASLTDGTPLVTAAALGGGMLVLIHTTATPAWSDLALSGAFVQILRWIVAQAGHAATGAADADGALQPIAVLDGFGRSLTPDATVQPIPAAKAATQGIDSRHPPGLYGRAGSGRALNLGDTLPALSLFDAAPTGAQRVAYGAARERDGMPALIAAAFLLFLFDWLAMIVLQAGWRLRRAGLAALMIACLLPLAARADPGPADYAGHVYLAFIKSGDAAVDGTVRSGLQTLAQILNDRTSVEPAGVAALDPTKDELAFFPLIYWPVRADSPTPSPEALRRVQDYLDHGGTILFDTADHAGPDENDTPNRLALQRIAGGLNIPPLVALPRDHVLTHTFYILPSMPGRFDGGTIWVEDQSGAGRDNVSSVIVGGNDWAAAWADAGDGDRHERSLRFGVNLMMYALTGNYKSDQIHLQQIMQRMGE